MFDETDQYQLASASKTIEIRLPDGRVISGPRGTAVGFFLRKLPEWDNPPIVAAIINGDLRELTYILDIDAWVQPVSMADMDGARLYRRSLTFLLEVAFEDLYPQAALTVDHSVASGGFFCQVMERAPLSASEICALEDRMRELVRMDIPFMKSQVPLAEAIAYFENKGMQDKVRLLRYRQKDHLVLYQLQDHKDYHHGYMVPSTGFLKYFALAPMGEGFVLRYTRRHSPMKLLPMPAYPKLLDTFRQYGAWLKRLGIESVGALNDAIAAGRSREVILVSEALQEQKIADIAQQVVERANQSRIVLIAGPSSSGKTTFSKRLAIQLLAQGLSPYPIELDNYFVNRDDTPVDENGHYDFEALGALNTGLLVDHLQRLVGGEEVQLPHYDFKNGHSEPGDIVRLRNDQLIILEGIHGLNPNLLPNIPLQETFRIYVSCLTQLNLDRHNRISTTDTRLLRRIVRDARDRGYSALQTVSRWESVRRGEKTHIFPYQENADAMFNSALVYELSALKLLAEPLLRQVPYGTMEHIEAKRLLAFLEWFQPIPEDLIPDNSILREFIGGSILKEFKLWESPADFFSIHRNGNGG
ncbi:uridine kinase [Longilinea arvoryzae]|uniref:Uridine kinase n=1 Tax=Longilinea arvoryzae TaxID=360412 RepID=A0A0S7BKZ0_9CHLR|nr:nucleoside kinase [Longilinea arvoryzae]GAP14437.1 uridine kinase [Longilinea arvoryzae]